MDDARALLNSLMGNDRNARADQRKVRKFTDAGFCKNYLVGLCPHDLFTNTKIDLGTCEKEHNVYVKEEFDKDPEIEKYKRKWRAALRVQLKHLLSGVDRRIGNNQLRIEREKEGGPAGASLEQKAKLAGMKDEVSQKLKEAETAADEGRYEDSRNVIKDSEALKRQIEDLESKRYEKYRKENICEVCGLIIDAEEVEANKDGGGWHIQGKQHIGYGLIRQKLKDLEADSALDKQNGIRSPTPSPVRVEKVESKRRKASKSRSPARGSKANDKKRRSRSRSAAKRANGRKGKSHSRSRRRKSRSRSIAKRKNASKKRADSSSDKRSRSRKKKSRSRDRKQRSRSKKKQQTKKDPSPKKKSKSPGDRKGKEEKKKKSKKEDGAKTDGAASQTQSKNSDASSKAAEQKAEGPAAVPKVPEALAPVPPAEPDPPKPEEQGARNRVAPVFLVFRKPGT